MPDFDAMTLEEFEKHLAGMDWTYEYANGNQWRRGRDELLTVQRYVRTLDPDHIKRQLFVSYYERYR